LQVKGFSANVVLWIVSSLVGSEIARSQVVPDLTLPAPSIVQQSGNRFTITGGTSTGQTLFHSLREFSVPTGGAAIFNNNLQIRNILTRVTGKAVSNIDGLIQTNGTANLFLLNPNGIVFGPNATLNLGGSFVATTATQFKFADGSEFSATNPQAPPLLSINVPFGLQFGSQPPVPIQVQGANLAVQTGRTLALVGGEMTIAGSPNPLATGLTAGGIPYLIGNGAVIPTTPGGRIELWSVLRGQVAIDQSAEKLTLMLTPAPIAYGNLDLKQGARIDTSGTGGGEIQIYARNLRLSEGARLLSITTGNQPGRTITLNTTESLKIEGIGGYNDTILRFVTGTLQLSDLQSGIFTLSFGSGSAGTIVINTPALIAHNGAYIASTTFGGPGGSVSVNAPNTIDLNRAFIASGTGIGNAGDAGDLTINTGRLWGRNNSILTTSSFGSGRGGDITINATDSIDISSDNPLSLESIITAARAFGGIFTSGLGTGDAGDVQISTQRLTLRSGAAIAASSFERGRGGNVSVQATRALEVIGRSPDGQLLSAITAVTEPESPGDGGNLTIQTDRLLLQDSGRISVRARGTGKAGNLDIQAKFFRLDNQAELEGNSAFGEGANIIVRSPVLVLSRNSLINTNARGNGSGGNITILSEAVAAAQNSDITANAVRGRGGNIQIRTQGLFGLVFRPTLTPQNDITASSQFGFDGNVTLNTLDFDFTQGLIELPEKLVDTSRQIAQTCSSRAQTNRFVVTGRGGLPPDPAEALNTIPVWVDERSAAGGSEMQQTTHNATPAPIAAPDAAVLQEASHWVKAPDGSIHLVAAIPVAPTIACPVHPLSPQR
jgi:filamentous hemagglutinin family protein